MLHGPWFCPVPPIPVTIALFASIVAIHLAAAISPGPSFVVAVRTAAADGFGAGVALAFGFGLGAVLWATAAMAGLALVFGAMPVLFGALKFVGAGFLLYVAVTMWRHARAPLDMPATGAVPRSCLGVVRFGFVTFASNPKPAIFFGAVFVGLVPADTPLIWRVTIIAAVFVNEFGWYVVVARAFSLARARDAYIRLKTPLDRAFGTLIAAFGLKIALT